MLTKRILPVAAAAVALPLGALGAPAPLQAPAGTVPVKHIVVLDLENHSFDNVLGYWCDQTHRCLGMPASVKLDNGTVVTPTVDPDRVPYVTHGMWGQRVAIDGGKMDGWEHLLGCQASKHYRCISGYQPRQIPNMIALAQHFSVSDHTFSMADSPSWGGHLYSVMASLDGFTGNLPGVNRQPGAPRPGPGWGCDSNKIAQWRSPAGTTEKIPSCVPDFSLGLPNGGAFEPTPARYAPTIMDRLQAAHRSWRIYGAIQGQNGYIWSTCPSLAECLYTQQSHIRQSKQFVTDARDGRLPNFSLILPGGATYRDSQHNTASMAAGDNWVGQVASAVMSGRDWTSTVLFITYDDCGCFYDQVPPGTNPDGTQQGPRVPLLIVSPYARPRYTDSTPTTFAGILAYTEHTFGLPSLSKNDARVYSFANAFSYTQAPLAPVRMVHRPLPPSARHLPPPDPNDPT